MPAPTSWDNEFPALADSVYLNTCSLGALSRRARTRVSAFHDEWATRGAPSWYDTWLHRLGELRAGYARVLGANPSELALHPSISTGAAVVASALDYERRPRVVTTELDFPTIAYQWLARHDHGVETVVLKSPDGMTVPPELFAEAVDERTALVATSHVYFTTGVRQDIGAIAAIAHEHGAWCYIDGYQGAGQVPVDVRAASVDFYAAGGLKWLLGGPGIAFLYARRELHPRLHPTVTGWFGHADQFAFQAGRLEHHADARRLETGTPGLAAVHAQLGGLELLAEVGERAVHDATRERTTELIAALRSRGHAPRVAADPASQTAIVTIADPDARDTVARLAARGIAVDARPGHVRVSPFFYNSSDDIETFVQAL